MKGDDEERSAPDSEDPAFAVLDALVARLWSAVAESLGADEDGSARYWFRLGVGGMLVTALVAQQSVDDQVSLTRSLGLVYDGVPAIQQWWFPAGELTSAGWQHGDHEHGTEAGLAACRRRMGEEVPLSRLRGLARRERLIRYAVEGQLNDARADRHLLQRQLREAQMASNMASSEAPLSPDDQTGEVDRA